MSSRFLIKLTLSPSGVFKASEGLGSRTSLNEFSPPLSIVPNFKDALEDCERNSDCPKYSVKAGWGLLGRKTSMSIKTSRALKERLAAIEIEYGYRNCLFITLTLPSDDPETFGCLAAWGSFAVNRLNQWLSDNHSRDSFARGCVWEYQKRGAPHLHICLGLSPKFGLHDDAFEDGCNSIDLDKLATFKNDLAACWLSILESIGDKESIDMFSSETRLGGKDRLLNQDDLGIRFCNVQVVEKSIVAYLSSYLCESNHEDSPKQKNALRKDFYPFATWAQWDRKSTELYRKYSVEITLAIDASEFETWRDIFESYYFGLEKAEETEYMHRENAFWKSDIMILKERGLAAVSVINDLIKDIKQSGIVKSLFQCAKFILKKTEQRDFILESDMHSLKFEGYLHKIESTKTALEVLLSLRDFASFMLQLEDELEQHSRFDSALSNCKQLEINYA